MQLKDELLRQMGLVAIDKPADADVGEAKLVAAGVDADDARDAEVPLEVRRGEGGDEAPGGGVDVDGDIDACLGFVLVKLLGHFLHGLVVTGVRAAHDHKAAPGHVLSALTRRDRNKSLTQRTTYTQIVFSSTYSMALFGSMR